MKFRHMAGDVAGEDRLPFVGAERVALARAHGVYREQPGWVIAVGKGPAIRNMVVPAHQAAHRPPDPPLQRPAEILEVLHTKLTAAAGTIRHLARGRLMGAGPGEIMQAFGVQQIGGKFHARLQILVRHAAMRHEGAVRQQHGAGRPLEELDRLGRQRMPVAARCQFVQPIREVAGRHRGTEGMTFAVTAQADVVIADNESDAAVGAQEPFKKLEQHQVSKRPVIDEVAQEKEIGAAPIAAAHGFAVGQERSKSEQVAMHIADEPMVAIDLAFLRQGELDLRLSSVAFGGKRTAAGISDQAGDVRFPAALAQLLDDCGDSACHGFVLVAGIGPNLTGKSSQIAFTVGPYGMVGRDGDEARFFKPVIRHRHRWRRWRDGVGFRLGSRRKRRRRAQIQGKRGWRGHPGERTKWECRFGVHEPQENWTLSLSLSKPSERIEPVCSGVGAASVTPSRKVVFAAPATCSTTQQPCVKSGRR